MIGRGEAVVFVADAPPYDHIAQELPRGAIIPFLGSAASLPLQDDQQTDWQPDEPNRLPKASELAEHLATRSNYPQGDDEPPSLRRAAQYFDLEIGRRPLEDRLDTIFSAPPQPTALHEYLASIEHPLVIVTTNYDDLLERAFTNAGRRFDLVVYTTDEKEYGTRLLYKRAGANEPSPAVANEIKLDLDSTSVIYKMHGSVDRTRDRRGQYVITDDDYVDYLTRMTTAQAIPAMLIEPLRSKPFLFLGYGLGDWNLRVLLSRLASRRIGSIKSWAVESHPSAFEKDYWATKEVRVYDLTIAEFLAHLRREGGGNG